jgi:hypothetical protein
VHRFAFIIVGVAFGPMVMVAVETTGRSSSMRYY